MKLHSIVPATILLLSVALVSSCGKDDAPKTPKADFSYTTSDPKTLPVTVTTVNNSTGENLSFRWTYESNTSTDKNATYSFNSGGLFKVKLVATNSFGSDSITKDVRISPYTQAYTSFNGSSLNLNAWEGKYITILARNNNLSRATMYNWLQALDTAYGYYKLITGRTPTILPRAYLNEKVILADVPATCSPAGCGNFGTTGLELQNNYFDLSYNAIQNNNQYDEGAFFEAARNFWFYAGKISYKTNDPIAEGYAVALRFLSMEAAGVNGSTFVQLNMPFPAFKQKVENLVADYLANTSLNWSNTLGANQGVPGSNLKAGDLFASFVLYLKKNYGGDTFIKSLWKQVEARPDAATTQDAVDNFFLAACAAANKNLTSLFQSWRWTLSASATAAATKYP